jgi:hypothetical protein
LQQQVEETRNEFDDEFEAAEAEVAKNKEEDAKQNGDDSDSDKDETSKENELLEELALDERYGINNYYPPMIPIRYVTLGLCRSGRRRGAFNIEYCI